MACVECRAPLPDEARFCPICGTRRADEDPADVAEYETAFATLGGRTESWAEAELAALRAELGIRETTHRRLLAARAPQSVCPVSASVDTRSVADFRAAEGCLLRVRVVNDGPRPLGDLSLHVTTTAIEGPIPVDRAGRAIGPGEEALLSALFRPALAGHHHATVRIVTVPLRGAEQHWVSAPIPFLVGAPASLQSQIHIDARSQKVGVFENIGGPARGGMVGSADWQPIQLSASSAPSTAPGHGATHGAPSGRTAGTGLVVDAGDPLLVELDGRRGPLVDRPDAPLGVGDRLQVFAIGADGAGRPLWSCRPAPVVAPAPAASLEVGPGDDLAARLATAPAGAKITVRGTHPGPLVLGRAIELTGVDAVLEGATGPVLKIGADVVLRGFTVRGAAPGGRYAADAIEIRSGRVVLQDCILSSDAAGNLTPGRAVAVTGPANVELRGCTVSHSGVGVAIDVSWSGFPTDTARGARVRVMGGTFRELGVGLAVAGADRELRAARVRFERVADAAVRVHKGASATVEDCVLGGSAAQADPGAVLVARGNT